MPLLLTSRASHVLFVSWVAAGLSVGCGPGTLTVSGAVQVSTLSLSPQAPPLPKGNRILLNLTARLSDGTYQNLTGTAQWASSDPRVAEVVVDGAKTFIRAEALGSATITATVDGQQASTVVAVLPPVLASLVIAPDPLVLRGGAAEARKLTAIGVFSDLSTQEETAAVLWKSTDLTVADVSLAGGAEGLVTGHQLGFTQVTAQLGNAMVSTTVKVTATEP